MAVAVVLAGLALPDTGAPRPASASTADGQAFGGWDRTEAMETVRQDHTATRLQDGTVLAAGGRLGDADDPEFYGGAERYDPDSGEWRRAGCFGNARDGRHVAAEVPDDNSDPADNQVLVVDECGPSAELYDPEAGTWTPTAPRTSSGARPDQVTGASGAAPLDGPSCGDHCGKVLVISTRTSQLYDPATDTWSEPVDLQRQPRNAHTTTRLDDGRVLVTGGYTQNEVHATAEIYNPEEGSWTLVDGPMGVGRAGHTATRLDNNRVLVTGGWKQQDVSPGVAVTRNSTTLASAEVFDTTTETWSPTGAMRHDRRGHTATRLDDGRVLVAGGEHRTHAGVGTDGMVPQAEVYLPTAGVWREAGTLEQARKDHVAALLSDGTVLLAGGRGPRGEETDVALRSTELYDPGQDPAADPDADPWAQTGSMTYPRSRHVTPVPPGGDSGVDTLLVIGGGSPIDIDAAERKAGTSAERFDVDSQEWSVVRQPRPAGRAGHTATLLEDGRVLAVGGRNREGVVATVEVYDPDREVWSPVDDLKDRRTGHTATLLADGRVLVAGGIGADDEPLASAEVLDLNGAQREWQPTASLTTPRADHTATRLPNGQVLVAGGHGPGGPTSSVERYAGGAWGGGPDMPTERSAHTATTLGDGSVVVVGGLGVDGTPVVAAERFRPGDADGGWSEAPSSMRTARHGHTATALSGGRLLVAGGTGTDGDPLGSAEVLTPGGTRSQTADLNLARTGHTATLLGTGRVLVAGGHSPNGLATDTAELFNPAGSPTGTWELTGTPRAARVGHTATRLDGPVCREGDSRPDWCGKVLVAGGHDARDADGQPLASAMLYDPRTGQWAPAGDLATPRDGHTATLLDDGRVLVAGGGRWQAGFPPHPGQWVSAKATAEIFDPTQHNDDQLGTWTQTGELNLARAGHTATRLRNGDVLVAGGSESSSGHQTIGRQPSAERYDPSEGTWKHTAPMKEGRAGHAAALMDEGDCGQNCGNVLVAGGYPSSAPLGEVYHPLPAGEGVDAPGPDDLPDGTPETQTPTPSPPEAQPPAPGAWRPTTAMAESRNSQPTATVLADGRVLVAGDDTNRLAEIYEPANERWTEAGDMVFGHTRHTATRLPNGNVLLTGGSVGGPAAELFAPDEEGEEAWRATASPTVSRSNHTATLLPPGPAELCGTNCGKVLVVGGTSEPSAELYAPAPQVDRITPTAGDFSGGTTVTIEGTGLASVQSVTFGGTSAEDVQPDPQTPDTKLTVTTPDMEVGGTVPVRVTTDGGTSAPVEFTFLGPPGKITNLSADAVASDEIHVSFDAVGKNGFDEPPASEYVIKQAASPIRNEAQFDGAQALCGATCTFSPNRVGDRVVLEVGGLQPDTEYYYAAKAVNDDGSVGPLSNTDGARTPGTSGGGDGNGGGDTGDGGTGGGTGDGGTGGDGDGTTGEDGGGDSPTGEDGGGTGGDGDGSGDGDPTGPAATGPAATGPGHPGQVVDLSATRLSRSEVRLTWSATGADGDLPPPAGDYVVRQATGPISEAGFADAFALCDGVCSFGPSEVGEQLTLTVGNLEPNTTYHYRLRALDGTGTPGPLSNAVQVTTTPTDLAEVCPTGQIDPAPFTDRSAIPQAHRTTVDCAYFHQIVSGFDDGAYHPARAVRRDQMATFIAGALDADGVELPPAGEGGFTDVAADSVHGEAIDRLAAAGIVVGGPGGLPADAYGPAQRIRRDQMASFLVRAVGYAVDADLEADQAGYFADVPPGNVHAANVDVAAERGLAHGFGDDTYRPGGDTRRDQMGTFVIRLLNDLRSSP